MAQTFHALQERHNHAFKKWGYMVLALERGDREKLNHYQQSLRNLLKDLEIKARLVQDADKRGDLNLMSGEIEILLDHVEKDLRQEGRAIGSDVEVGEDELLGFVGPFLRSSNGGEGVGETRIRQRRPMRHEEEEEIGRGVEERMELPGEVASEEEEMIPYPRFPVRADVSRYGAYVGETKYYEQKQAEKKRREAQKRLREQEKRKPTRK